MVHRFVARTADANGRDVHADRELLAQGRERARASLRGLLRDLSSSDRFRFMVAFTMYCLGFDLRSGRAVMLEYCPPGNKPGYSEETVSFLDYAYQKRPDPRLLEGIVNWVPYSDGALAETLSSLLPRMARTHPRDLLAALKGKPLLLWRMVGWLLHDNKERRSPERAYPALVAIATRRDDPLNGFAGRLLREMASSWPAPSEYPPAAARPQAGPFLVPPPVSVRDQWYVPASPLLEWLGARGRLSDDKSSMTVSWRGKSYTWTRQTGLLVRWRWVAYLPIQDFGRQFGEPVSLRADGRAIDFGTPGEGRLHATIPVGWQTPVPPKGLSKDEMQIWRRLLRPDARPGNVLCEPYDIRIAGRWAAAKVHPLNIVTDDALVLLDGRWGAWRIIALGTDLPAGGRNYGIPVEARKKLGLPF
jgi:hypothetical protein